VNTRLQVEHPVSEEVTGIDLVQEQLRIAGGEAIGYADPPTRGHAMEFRINSEDPGRGFLPTPGRVSVFGPPAGPGVRVDSGVEAGSVVGAAWDSLLAKLVVTGETREQVLRRAARALAEFEIRGIATVLPFHRAVVTDPAFTSAPFSVHTRWIETEFVNTIPAADPTPDPGGNAMTEERRTIVVEVDGRRLTVSLPGGLDSSGGGAVTARGPVRRTPQIRTVASTETLAAPMQGTIVRVAVAEGDHVAEGDLVVVLEAMKMEQPITAHRAGVVTGFAARVGTPVTVGAALCQINNPVPSGNRE
jgi:acetyl-CoA/propionyl-CoA carboxylase biotin carboxyl carrier protein